MQLIRLFIASISLLGCLTKIGAIPTPLEGAQYSNSTGLSGALDQGSSGDQAPVLSQDSSSGSGRGLTECPNLQNQITVRLGTTTTAAFTLAKGAWLIGWGVINDLAIENVKLQWQDPTGTWQTLGSWSESTGQYCLNIIRVFAIPKTFRFIFTSDSETNSYDITWGYTTRP